MKKTRKKNQGGVNRYQIKCEAETAEKKHHQAKVQRRNCIFLGLLYDFLAFDRGMKHLERRICVVFNVIYLFILFVLMLVIFSHVIVSSLRDIRVVVQLLHVVVTLTLSPSINIYGIG